MFSALVAALFFTVALLVTHAYFLMGSIPLLILKHDVPMDSRFVRAFYTHYYRAAFLIACAAAVTYGLAGHPVFAAGTAVLALLAVVLRRKVLPRMDLLMAQMQISGTSAVRAFRRIHVTSITVNLAQLVAVVWGLLALSIQLKG